jgi:hypothetical protein
MRVVRYRGSLCWRPHSDALGARRIADDHVFRGFALDVPYNLSQFRLDDEAVAVATLPV